MVKMECLNFLPITGNLISKLHCSGNPSHFSLCMSFFLCAFCFQGIWYHNFYSHWFTIFLNNSPSLPLQLQVLPTLSDILWIQVFYCSFRAHSLVSCTKFKSTPQSRIWWHFFPFEEANTSAEVLTIWFNGMINAFMQSTSV